MALDALFYQRISGLNVTLRQTLKNLFNGWYPVDGSRNLLSSNGIAIPTAGSSGYATGCIFTLRGASLGQAPTWVNIGSSSSCLFVPTGQLLGYGFTAAGGPIDCVNGSAGLNVGEGHIVGTDLCFATHAVSDDTDVIISVTAVSGKNYATLTGSADPLVAHDYFWCAARNQCVPTWDIFAAGTHTTAGGNAAEAITVTGAVVGDLAFVTYGATNDTDTIAKAVVTANTLTVTMSADPSTAHSLHYVILRPRGTFKPSHYIAYAGKMTTAGGDATEVATVTGVLSTDVVISDYHTTNDSDKILKVVPTANTITWTLSADPGTDHGLNYIVLRAY